MVHMGAGYDVSLSRIAHAITVCSDDVMVGATIEKDPVVFVAKCQGSTCIRANAIAGDPIGAGARPGDYDSVFVVSRDQVAGTCGGTTYFVARCIQNNRDAGVHISH